ncbi:hypothetical protein OG285_25295 [Streptomyces sp. NBC_01471]|uniref:hypothetical protein n=1 Tax=Streptomyces sp. NBC_01471 TaxID=2903879 RepID=UPI00324CED26
MASTVTACGAGHEGAASKADTTTPEAHAEPGGSMKSPQAATPQAGALQNPVSAPTDRGEDRAAQDEAAEERRNSAPSGDIITQPPRSGTPQGEEKFGKAVATQGDLTVYAARRHGTTLTVPCKITNSGHRRASYTFRIRVTGPDGYNATAQASLDVVGLYPGTSWPTELAVQQSGKPAPAQPKITIEELQRTPHRQ